MSRKIAIVINSSWNIYNFRRGLIEDFLANGDEVVAITPTDGYEEKFKEWGVKHIAVSMDSSGLNPIKDVKYLRQLKRMFRSENPDIVLSYTIKSNIYSSIAAKALGIPIITNVSGLGTTFLWKGWIRRVAVTLYNRAFRSANFIFFQNPDDRKLFLKHVKVDSVKTGLLPGSGIDLERYKSQLPDFNSPIRILVISRLIVEKGIVEYINVAERLTKKRKDVQFFLLGKYEPYHTRSISAENFGRISNEEFMTYLGERDDVIEVISQADLVVLPSYREGTPRTLLEAAAMSRPLIATDVPGCKEVIADGENGFLCEVKSVESLESKIELFLSLSNDEKMKMADYSRKLVEERFDENIVINEYSRKIKQLLN